MGTIYNRSLYVDIVGTRTLLESCSLGQKEMANIQQWLEWDRTDADKIRAMSDSEKTKVFASRMAFGTAGLRSTMGPGPSQMNDLTIIQTSQGLLKYAENVFGLAQLQEKGIVVGHDARYNSYKWSRLLAACCKAMNIKCYAFSKITPTPYTPFAITHYSACLGVMITASHNPKQDNGYKVYWNNGSQIISPHDKGISAEILNNLVPWSNDSWDTSASDIIDPYAEVNSAYMQNLKRHCHSYEKNAASDLQIVYTPVHGVGYEAVKEAVSEVFGFKNFHAVPEQYKPDPEFSTVVFPNPEEGKGVLELSFKHADKVGSNLVLASDPDADRLAVAERANASSPWRVFTGNECGALLGHWAWRKWKEQNPGKSGKDCYMLCSTVSSMILKAMATIEGFNFEDTLTGFKWMGNRADELKQAGKTVLFAYEEAIGFMYGDSVLDKDGVSAAAVFAEMYESLDGKTLTEYLNSIYDSCGWHVSNASYYISHDKAQTNKMFEAIQSNYPTSLGPYEICGIRDLNKGYDSRQSDKKAVLPTQSSHMITFYFTNGATVTLRTSGTEPKIKYYSEMVGATRAAVQADIDKLVGLIKTEWYKPEQHGFIARATD